MFCPRRSSLTRLLSVRLRRRLWRWASARRMSRSMRHMNRSSLVLIPCLSGPRFGSRGACVSSHAASVVFSGLLSHIKFGPLLQTAPAWRLGAGPLAMASPGSDPVNPGIQTTETRPLPNPPINKGDVPCLNRSASIRRFLPTICSALSPSPSLTGMRRFRISHRWEHLHDCSAWRSDKWPLLCDRYAHPTCGGPPPHRHDFEETFILLQGRWR